MTGRLARFLRFVAVAVVVSAAATVLLGLAWTAIGGGAMSLHGWIALGIGVFGTAALAWGLMALAFRSDREGWDDRADDNLNPGRDRDEP